jgi:hypothetical protein
MRQPVLLRRRLIVMLGGAVDLGAAGVGGIDGLFDAEEVAHPARCSARECVAR